MLSLAVDAKQTALWGHSREAAASLNVHNIKLKSLLSHIDRYATMLLLDFYYYINKRLVRYLQLQSIHYTYLLSCVILPRTVHIAIHIKHHI